MSKSDGFLMDFTVSAHNGSLVINRLFVFLLGGPDVVPLLEKGFVELDVNFAAKHKGAGQNVRTPPRNLFPQATVNLVFLFVLEEIKRRDSPSV